MSFCVWFQPLKTVSEWFLGSFPLLHSDFTVLDKWGRWLLYFSQILPQQLTFSTKQCHDCSAAERPRCDFISRETFGGENAALNKVRFLICVGLQETPQVLCCVVSASCLPLFLTRSFSSPLHYSPLFSPPVVWVIDLIPHRWRTTSGLDTHHLVRLQPRQLSVTMLFLRPR